jgi:hypothetical protein
MADYTGLAQAFGDVYLQVAAWALRWWVGDAGPGLAEVRQQAVAVRPVGVWVAAAVTAAAVVAVGALMTARRRGHELADAVLGLARLALAVTGGWLLLATAWTLSGHLADWILGVRREQEVYVASLERALGEVEPILAVALSIVGIAVCLSFVATCLTRFVAACLVGVFLPAAAGLSLVRSTRVLRFALSWTAAILAFEPLGAVIYRVGHRLVSSADDPVLVLLGASVSSVLAAASLPLVVRVAGGSGREQVVP